MVRGPGAEPSKIYDLPEALGEDPGCEDCKRLDNLMLLARKL